MLSICKVKCQIFPAPLSSAPGIWTAAVTGRPVCQSVSLLAGRVLFKPLVELVDRHDGDAAAGLLAVAALVAPLQERLFGDDLVVVKHVKQHAKHT